MPRDQPSEDDDDIDPAQAEREIQSFLDAAEALDGPPVADLAAGAARIGPTPGPPWTRTWRAWAPTS